MSASPLAPNSWQSLFDRQVGIRAVSGVALAVIAVASAVVGGWWAAAVAAIVTVAIHQEWTWLTEESRQPAIYYSVGLVIAIAYLAAGMPGTGVVLVLVAVATAAVSSASFYRPLGVAYAGVFALGVLLLRYSPTHGMEAAVILFTLVWATDIAAFFTGRAIGGPRLWAAVSPNKTWSGALCGLAGGIAVAVVAAALFGVPVTPALVVVLAFLSVASEAGDLFESWVKRRMGEKDSGWLLPGHGGFMDRVDGLVFASGLALSIGWLHSGGEGIARGLLTW